MTTSTKTGLNPFSLYALLLCAVSFGSCAEKGTAPVAPVPPEVPPPTASTPSPAENNEGLPTTSPLITAPDGWTGMVLDANFATTKIDVSGHYSTDKNMCQRKGEGVFELKTWNNLSDILNRAVAVAPLAPARCVDAGPNSKFYEHGFADVTLTAGGRRTLLEHKSGQICSTIADETVSNQLIALVEKTILLADRAEAQDCPNYRP